MDRTSLPPLHPSASAQRQSKTRSTSRTLCIALAAGTLPVLAAPSASAQTGVAIKYAINVLGGASQYSASRAVFGEYNGTALLDVALLRGDRITFAYDPSLGEASGDMEGVFSDLASYGGLNSNTDDGLLVAGPSISLSRLIWDPATSLFTPQPIFEPGTPNNTIFSDLERLDVGQVDGDLDDDVVVVHSDRRTLQQLQGLGDGEFAVVPPQQFSPTLPGDVVDVCIVNGDGFGGANVVAFSASDMLVVNWQGQAVFEGRINGVVVAAETISAGPNGEENCAVLVASQTGKRLLYVYDGQTFAVQQTVNLSDWYPSQLSAADYDGDGHTDLTVTCGWTHGLMCLLQANGGSFHPPSMAVPLSGPNSPMVASGSAVAMMDVEGDSDTDALYPVALRDQLYMAKNAAFNHADLAPRLLDTGQKHVWSPSSNLVKVRYEWEGGVPVGQGSTNLPQGASHLQVIVWGAVQTGASTYQTMPNPIEDVALTLATYPYDTSPNTPESFVELELDPFATLDPATDFAFVTARYVRLDPAGAIETAWPHQTTYVATLQNPAGLNYLDSLPFTSGDLRYYDIDPFIAASGGTEVGGGGATGCVPDYPPNAPPPQNPPSVP